MIHAGAECVECDGLESKTSQNIAVGVFFALVAVIWYFISWRPYLAKSEEEQEQAQGTGRRKTLCGSRRLREYWKRFKAKVETIVAGYLDSNATDYAKILISFFQARFS